MFKEVNIQEFMKNEASYDLIIDARSPNEYENSKITNARNFYALNNPQHEEVGTLYKNISKSQAKVLGASYICENVALHVKKIYESFPLGSKIGIYCARGGLRSKSVAIILANTGYQVDKLDKGYKTYRGYVLDYLEHFKHKNFITLGGNTGCGKSELLRDLHPSIDIESLANHFGSTFGAIKGKQPSQKEFENTIFHNLSHIDENAWIFVEGESKKLGKLVQPSLLYKRIHSSYRVEITAPLEQRVQRILKDYINIDEKFFFDCINHITPYIKKVAKQEAIKAFEHNDLEKVAEILLVEYYDRVYSKQDSINIQIDNSNHDLTLANLKDLHAELSKKSF